MGLQRVGHVLAIEQQNSSCWLASGPILIFCFLSLGPHLWKQDLPWGISGLREVFLSDSSQSFCGWFIFSLPPLPHTMLIINLPKMRCCPSCWSWRNLESSLCSELSWKDKDEVFGSGEEFPAPLLSHTCKPVIYQWNLVNDLKDIQVACLRKELGIVYLEEEWGSGRDPKLWG